jgi:hypothetical protein
MTTDYEDQASIDAFAAHVEAELDAAAPGHAMWPLIGCWLVAGALLTLAVRFSVGALYVLGLLVVAFAVTGFLRASGRGGWWGL